MSDDQNIEINTSEDADRLLADIERPSDEIQDNPAPKPEEFEFSVGGKQIKAGRDEVLKWAQMGYDAPNRIGALSKEIDGWKSRANSLTEQEQKIAAWNKQYGEVDAYLQKDPAFRDHLMQSWAQKQAELQGGPQIPPQMQQFMQQMQEKLSIIDELQQERLQARMAKEDEALDSQINKIKEKYPHVDFAARDESGKSLEYRVLEYAKENGIKNFKTAFNDFYHDDLMKHYESLGREAAVKGRQQQTKLGVLGITENPIRKAQSQNIKSKSYNDLAQEALAELGIA